MNPAPPVTRIPLPPPRVCVREPSGITKSVSQDARARTLCHTRERACTPVANAEAFQLKLHALLPARIHPATQVLPSRDPRSATSCQCRAGAINCDARAGLALGGGRSSPVLDEANISAHARRGG